MSIACIAESPTHSDSHSVAEHDLIARLLAEHAIAKDQIDRLGALMAGDLGNAVHYYIQGNAGNDKLQRALYLDKLFRKERAYMALDAEYWSRSLNETHLMECMPQARRDHWKHILTSWQKDASGKGPSLPPFDEATVRDALGGLLALRGQYFAERVDGVFSSLSGLHATNCRDGFYKRMIMRGVYSEHGSIGQSEAGVINDLRSVIAKFMGRDEPSWRLSYLALQAAYAERGQWIRLDGGSIRLRAFKAGTVHIEVHPGIAERLNQVLAGRYPNALPSRFRSKPIVTKDTTDLLEQPQLTFGAVALLADAYVSAESKTARMPYQEHACLDDHALASHALFRLGGTPVDGEPGLFQFAGDPTKALAQVTLTGCMPLPSQAAPGE